jgi:probable DNA metabolism protein
VHFRYDGSYPGLLTVLQRCFAWDQTPARIDRREASQPGLFSEVVAVPTDPDRADELLAAVRRRLSAKSARYLLHAWFSEAPGVELALYRYLALGWRLGHGLDDHLVHPAVAAVHRLADRVCREAHRLKGLARFRQTEDGLYYAPLEPDHFVLPLLAPHFAARLAGQRWLLHDRRRGRGVLCDGRSWVLAELELEDEPRFSDEERHWQALWRRFFTSAAIAERHNPRLQRQCMPMKYWKYLVEMNGETASPG